GGGARGRGLRNQRLERLPSGLEESDDRGSRPRAGASPGALPGARLRRRGGILAGPGTHALPVGAASSDPGESHRRPRPSRRDSGGLAREDLLAWHGALVPGPRGALGSQDPPPHRALSRRGRPRSRPQVRGGAVLGPGTQGLRRGREEGAQGLRRGREEGARRQGRGPDADAHQKAQAVGRSGQGNRPSFGQESVPGRRGRQAVRQQAERRSKEAVRALEAGQARLQERQAPAQPGRGA
ncbi:hypothetical protein H632_c4652p0, partial [Helicosporidium sp. ATCC 50920]